MINFTKMEGLGNDYVYVDCTNKSTEEINEIAKLAVEVSDRHFGIGSDGLILICSSDVADFKMQMYNSDGSQAQMCGNGIRCVGKFVYDKGLTDKNVITVETLAGIKTLDMNVENNQVVSVKVNMGAPILDESSVPCVATYKDNEVSHVKLDVLDKSFDFTCVSMGNPHAITIIDDVDNFDIEKYGKIVECDSHFPEKTNVEFIEIIDRNHIKMRVYERGTGETLACGTGACASVVASFTNNLTDRNVNVKLLGGTLSINYNEDGHVYMTGEATTVFNGEYSIENKKKVLRKY
jgi:diaminopimelate epimerase